MSSNEIAQVVHATDEGTSTSLEVLPPRQPVQAVARQVLMEHAELASMAYEFATKLVGTKMVPVRFRGQPEEATAAILYGAELGLGPIAALQNIFEVHGSPGIYARTAQALLEAKGFRFKTLEDTNEAVMVAGAKPDTHVIDWFNDYDEQSRFTYEDAELAGWAPRIATSPRGGVEIRGVRYEANKYDKLDGNEKYLTQPRQMLWAKAMMEVCRRLSPATLLGIAYSVEELESEAARNNPDASFAPAPAAAPLTVEEILAAAPDSPPTETVDPEPESDPAPAKRGGKREAAREQRETERAQKANLKAATKKLPPESRDRVAASLAKARAGTTETPETAPVSDPEPQADPPESSPGTAEPEPSGDPSEEQPTGDDEALRPDLEEEQAKAIDNAYADELAGQTAAAEVKPEPAKAPADWDGAKPALREQLKELSECIAEAGFKPTDESRAAWFAWLSQEVNRDITANNQLSRGEIVGVIKAMRDEQV